MKPRSSAKAHRNKPNYMSDEAFAALKKALEEALAFERGKRRIHITRIRAPRPPVSNGIDATGFVPVKGEEEMC